MASSVTDRDKGYRALMLRLQSAANAQVKVGVFGEKADAKAENGDLTVGDLATIHEFGGGTVPERSWLRGYVDENQTRLDEMSRRAAQAVAGGKMSPEQALNAMGLKIAGEIKQRISENIPPPLAESTIKAKGSSVALVDSGQFRGSIAHEVVKDGGQ